MFWPQHTSRGSPTIPRRFLESTYKRNFRIICPLSSKDKMLTSSSCSERLLFLMWMIVCVRFVRLYVYGSGYVCHVFACPSFWLFVFPSVEISICEGMYTFVCSNSDETTPQEYVSRHMRLVCINIDHDPVLLCCKLPSVCICRSLGSSVLVRRKPHTLRRCNVLSTLFLSILIRAIPSPVTYPR